MHPTVDEKGVYSQTLSLIFLDHEICQLIAHTNQK